MNVKCLQIAAAFLGLTIVSAAAEDSWQSRYELGAGDVLNLQLYGQPDLAVKNIPIAPDGTVSYLQASNVKVAGLSIPEARKKLQEELTKYYRGPRVIITPSSIASKNYTILGKVEENGSYPLTQPITLLEAIAESGGLIKENDADGNPQELADLSRSFIVRKGSKLKVDMEALYHKGDVKQNVPVEPGDYIYIASNVYNDFYVFGAVTEPGSLRVLPGLTVVGAVSNSTGFSNTAWRKKVVLVRGSLENPVPTMINVDDILKGKSNDVLVQSGDIIYVHDRPWHRLEEVLDNAIISFIRGATRTFVDINYLEDFRGFDE